MWPVMNVTNVCDMLCASCLTVCGLWKQELIYIDLILASTTTTYN